MKRKIALATICTSLTFPCISSASDVSGWSNISSSTLNDPQLLSALDALKNVRRQVDENTGDIINNIRNISNPDTRITNNTTIGNSNDKLLSQLDSRMSKIDGISSSGGYYSGESLAQKVASNTNNIIQTRTDATNAINRVNNRIDNLDLNTGPAVKTTTLYGYCQFSNKDNSRETYLYKYKKAFQVTYVEHTSPVQPATITATGSSGYAKTSYCTSRGYSFESRTLTYREGK